MVRQLLAVAAMAGIATAQPIGTDAVPCPECERGNRLLDSLGDAGAELRASAGDIGAASQLRITGRELTSEQWRELERWEARLPDRVRAHVLALQRLDDQALVDIGYALCTAGKPTCDEHAPYIAAAIRCAGGQCSRAAVHEPAHLQPTTCDPYVVHVRSPATGAGFELASGRHDDAQPVDGRAWSAGVELRRRLRGRLGMFARVDRLAGRDRAQDLDGDGRDDVATPGVTRWTVLAGPSLVLGARSGDIARFAQIDLGAGYLATRSSAADGAVAGVDVSYQLAVVRAGIRAVQGFGDARDARALLAHVGIVVGAAPQYSYGAGCGQTVRGSRTRLALGIDLPVSGWGFTPQLGYLAPGVGLEAAYHLAARLDLVARGDLVAFTAGDRERVLYHTVLAGGRIDLSSPDRRQIAGCIPSPSTSCDASADRTGWSATALAGYALATGPEPSSVGSGPVADLALGWGLQGSEGAAWIRLHGRVGIAPANADLRAILLSIGGEIRLDPTRWTDRD